MFIALKYSVPHLFIPSLCLPQHEEVDTKLVNLLYCNSGLDFSKYILSASTTPSEIETGYYDLKIMCILGLQLMSH